MVVGDGGDDMLKPIDKIPAADPGVVPAKHVLWSEEDEVSPVGGQIVMPDLPGFRVVVEPRPFHSEVSSLIRRQMCPGKGLCVPQQVVLDQAGREVADVVPPDTLIHETDLLHVAAPRYLFLAEVAEDRPEVVVEGDGEIGSESIALVADEGEAEPVLPDLLEVVPRPEEAAVAGARSCLVP